MLQLYSCILLSFLVYTTADTPSNCTYEDARGKWHLRVSAYSPTCDNSTSVLQFHEVELLYPNRAIDKYGNVGEWTLIYNQGFEFTISHRKWLVMFDYDYKTTASLCHLGMPGWTHDTLGRQWYCFVAQKIAYETPRPTQSNTLLLPLVFTTDELYTTNHHLVEEINKYQKSWKAVDYPAFSQLTLKQLQRMSGGIKSVMPNRPRMSHLRSKRVSVELARLVSALPASFDWRHPPNEQPSPITPVRAQAACGSCYSFASCGMLEARIQLSSNFTMKPILSPQDVVDCSPYSQGCDGGFPYLVAGKYAEDFGLPLEECNPYTAVHHDHCTTKKQCQRFYATEYHYLGGYYGACNQELMMLELVHKGPFAVGFEVYPDFKYYKSGIYHHTGLQDKLNKFNPFELTNHAVLVVGYGVDETSGEAYWAVKNSWGTEWGEDGFFRIRRGKDECGIESIAVSADIIL